MSGGSRGWGWTVVMVGVPPAHPPSSLLLGSHTLFLKVSGPLLHLERTIIIAGITVQVFLSSQGQHNKPLAAGFPAKRQLHFQSLQTKRMKRQKAEVVYLLLVEHLLLQLLHHLALVVDLVILQRQTRQLVSGIVRRARCGSAHTQAE